MKLQKSNALNAANCCVLSTAGCILMTLGSCNLIKGMHAKHSSDSVAATYRLFYNSANSKSDSIDFLREMLFAFAFADVEFVCLESPTACEIKVLKGAPNSSDSTFTQVQVYDSSTSINWFHLSKLSNKIVAVNSNLDTLHFASEQAKRPILIGSEMHNWRKMQKWEYRNSGGQATIIYTDATLPKYLSLGLNLDVGEEGIYEVIFPSGLGLRLTKLAITQDLRYFTFQDTMPRVKFSLIDSLAGNSALNVNLTD